MKGTMKVAVMNGIGQMGYTNRDIPQPKDNEVLVKLEYVGICGSDMHYYETGRIGDYVVEPPFIFMNLEKLADIASTVVRESIIYVPMWCSLLLLR